jgi:hypothetical protein
VRSSKPTSTNPDLQSSSLVSIFALCLSSAHRLCSLGCSCPVRSLGVPCCLPGPGPVSHLPYTFRVHRLQEPHLLLPCPRIKYRPAHWYPGGVPQLTLVPTAQHHSGTDTQTPPPPQHPGRIISLATAYRGLHLRLLPLCFGTLFSSVHLTATCTCLCHQV